MRREPSIKAIQPPGGLDRLAGIVRRSLVLIWPDNCPLCGTPLNFGETPVCLECLVKIPRIATDRRLKYVGAPGGNEVIERSWFFYDHSDPSHLLIHHIKYHDRRNLARKLGREFAMQKLLDDIALDVILPIPLHWTKQLRRGYNQSNEIARGIKDVLPQVCVQHNLRAVRAHETQTHRGRDERNENVRGIFSVRRPEELNGRHIALLDDVITTGATMYSALQTVLEVAQPASVTFLSLARTRSGIG